MEERLPLNEYINALSGNYARFSRAHSEIRELIEGLLEQQEIFVHTAMTHFQEEHDVGKAQLWKTASVHIKSAFARAIAGDHEGVYSTLRLAAEIVRDIAAIGSSTDNWNLWASRNRKDPRYKKTFRFNQEDGSGSGVLKIYNLCSDLGVHGHIYGAARSVPIGETIHGDENFIILEYPHEARLNDVHFCLMSAHLIINMAFISFPFHQHPKTRPICVHWTELFENFGEIIKELKIGLDELPENEAQQMWEDAKENIGPSPTQH